MVLLFEMKAFSVLLNLAANIIISELDVRSFMRAVDVQNKELSHIFRSSRLII